MLHTDPHDQWCAFIGHVYRESSVQAQSNNYYLSSLLGNSGKLVTLKTSSLMKFVKWVFQEQSIRDDLESWTCEASESRTRDDLESWTCEGSESRTRDDLESWTCEASESRTYDDLESQTCGVTNFGVLGNSGICRRSGSGVMAREDFTNRGIHEPLRSKVKDVVSKSPGLACELVAGL
jgi:hypothetical protein